MKQVPWTKKLTEEFIDKASLNSDEAYIIRARVKGVPVSRMAMDLCRSESSIHRMIKVLKVKYDFVQAEYPEDFPKRKWSAKEVYMDKH